MQPQAEAHLGTPEAGGDTAGVSPRASEGVRPTYALIRDFRPPSQ